jgi:hypothetical protein
MSDIIPNEKNLTPSFHINDDKLQTLSERFEGIKELRKKLSDNMLTDFYADEQKQLNSCAKSINGETK